MDSTEPWLFLDMDGVLNVKDGDEPHRITINEADLPSSPFVKPPDPGATQRTLTITLVSAHRTWLRELAKVYRLVWSTTWEHLANEHIAPLLELPALPYVKHSEIPAHLSDVLAGEPSHWKMEGILRFADGTPFAWVDDQAYLYVDTAADDEPDRLVIAPRHHEGMTRDHVNRLLAAAPRLTMH